MFIVRAKWYCELDGVEVRDVKLFSASNHQELGKMLDKHYGDTLFQYDARWIGEDDDNIDLTEEIATVIEQKNC